LLWREKYQLIHARSYIAATMAWLIMRVTSIRLLFDMRGFWVDERVDGGIWSADSWIVRLARWWERRILREADAIVVLAATAIPHLDSLARRTLRAPVVVVPTSVDLDRFRPQDRPTVRRALGLPEEAFILVYSGSLGTWYLGRETFEVAEAVASQVDKFAMIVLTRETQLAEALLPSAIQARTRILTAFHSEMPAWVAAADAGLAFIRPRFSKVASCPTKIGEYLACGVPVATTDGIGDVSVLLDERVSVLFSDWSPSSLREGATRLVRLAVRPDTVERCRAVAAEHFSLERAVHDLRGLYQRCSLDE
jgi:glycosyltransferase involved in cell wall biosynthesis